MILPNPEKMQKSLQEGDRVIAARKMKNSHALSTACHNATVVAITPANHRGKQFITLRYDEDRSPNYAKVDTIKFVLRGTKGEATTVIPAEEESAASAVATLPVPSVPQVPLVAKEGLAGSQKVPGDFLQMNTKTAFKQNVPHHILSRWQQIDAKLRVGELFSANNRAIMALEGVRLQSLTRYTGQSCFEDVPCRTSTKSMGHMGVLESMISANIKGRSRATKKGVMFFFLMCRDPESVVWSAFQKRQRNKPFTLAEQCRLVAILADPANQPIRNKLMQQWNRSELDAGAGDKGDAHYWNMIGDLFNNPGLAPPPPCVAFADYIKTLDGDYEYDYSTTMLPEYRCPDFLKSQWSKLRGAYSKFYTKYTQSGANEPDPTCYTKDLPTLLMHHTWHRTPEATWAAKMAGNGIGVDESGDGTGTDIATTKRKRRKVAADQSKGDDHKLVHLTCAALYETLHTVPACSAAEYDEEECAKHLERVRRVDCLMDKCLTMLEHEF